MLRPSLPLALLCAITLPVPRAAADHEPWLLAALETELGPRFSAVLADASHRSAGRSTPLAGLWTPEADGCRTEMVALLPGERGDGFQHWRRVAPGETMAPVRVGRWQEGFGALGVQVAMVAAARPLVVPPLARRAARSGRSTGLRARSSRCGAWPNPPRRRSGRFWNPGRVACACGSPTARSRC
jgi:hypothetical protein